MGANAVRPRIGLTSWKRPVKTQVGDPEQLFTLAEEYVDAVRRAGGLPVILPPAPLAAASEAMAMLDGLILTGGGDIAPAAYAAPDEGVSLDVDPVEDAWDIALVAAARDAGKPFFGICRGMQVLNVSLGGTLRQDICGTGTHPPISEVPAEAVGFRHPVTIYPGTRLHGLLGASELRVNSIHHQAVARLGDGLRPAAEAPDGTVEALEYDDSGNDASWSALAVQWHPERLPEGPDQRLFDDLLERAARAAEARGVALALPGATP